MGHAFVKLPPAARGALVAEVASWAKAYTASAEFKEAWAQNRAAKQPLAKDAGTQKAWQSQFPEDPQGLIKTRLREFLEACRDVDFGAKVDPESGQFLDRKYEQQSSEWKLCYRAGPEAVAAGRAIATAWVEETASAPAK
jgi:hypothetical protein